MTLPVSVVLAALEAGVLPPPVGLRPSVRVYARAGDSSAGGLAGRGGRLYRLQPEVVLGVRPWAGVEVYAGGGLGPAYLVRSSGRSFVPSASGILGLRLGLGGAQTFAFVARAEGVGGGGVAVTLDLRFSGAP